VRRIRTDLTSATTSLRQQDERTGTLQEDLTQLGKRIDTHQAELLAATQRLAATTSQEIEAALSKPRALPSDQFEEMSTEVVGRLLEQLAAYGYTPPVEGDPEGAEGRPRVGPLAEETNPVLAKEMFGTGYSAFFSAGQMSRALEYFARAAGNDPRNPVYRYFLGLALYQSGRVDEALAQVKAARRLETPTAARQVRGALQRVQGPSRMWLERTRLSS
jgi:tetratricopeptide (TPR) repeat protein